MRLFEELPRLCRRGDDQWIADTAYFPERYGEIGVPYLIQLIEHKTVPKLLYVPHVVINRTNIDTYYQPRC